VKLRGEILQRAEVGQNFLYDYAATCREPSMPSQLCSVYAEKMSVASYTSIMRGFQQGRKQPSEEWCKALYLEVGNCKLFIFEIHLVQCQ
jgi:hypothetical protein